MPVASRRGLLLLASFALLGRAAGAQPNTLQPPRQLAPGVYAILQGEPIVIADANVLIVINDEDVIVVDANILPGSARHVIGEIRKLTPKPVRYVINTHWHSDHHYGNAVYREAYPGVEFIQHVNTRRDIIARDVPALAKNVETGYPEQLARIRKALETGKTSTGADVTPAMRSDFTNLIPILEAFVTEMKVTPLVPGTLVVQDSLVLHRGDRRIIVKYLGRGNTAGDLVVHLPKERIVATGDLVVHPIPFSFFSHLGDWPNTLRALKGIDAGTIMPGHGPIMADWAYVDQLIPLIESTWEQVKRAVASGADLETTRKQVNLDRFRDVFAGADERRRRQFGNLFQTPAVEAAFNELRPDTTRKHW
ncbi:MAG TPA: MBL fold metallo-hydrolase [Gemmatimonadaceae bacterium]|nr:MBL fold metallo-hydrolase [Gemmatimonadaceae bacterium]